MRPVLSIIGIGRLGEAIAGSLLRSGWTTAQQVVCTDVDSGRVAEVSAMLGIRSAATAREAVEAGELLLLAVKPQSMRELLAEIAPFITTAHTVVSVAAGIPLAVMQDALPEGTAVVRVMPNTPILVGEAMSAMTAGPTVDPERLDLVESLLAEVGQVVRVSEDAMDAVTAVSGSGPAYVFFLAEAMTAAAQNLGLPPEQARTLVEQTILGAATLLREDGRSAADLRAMVTSPNGTTQAAIETLQAHDVTAAFNAAIAAAARRSQELAAS